VWCKKVQEQMNVTRRPNLPAREYWANNKDNTFRKDNAPATGMMPGSTAKPSKTGVQPEANTARPMQAPVKQNQSMGPLANNMPYQDSPAVTVPIMGAGAFPQTGKMQYAPGTVQGMVTAADMQDSMLQSTGSMLPPGSYATCAMAQTPSSFTDQESGTSVQARCGRVSDLGYIQGYLRTQIGRQVKIEFLIGSNMFVDREGYLVDVGIDYLIINEINTDDLLLCDMYSIKFVKIYF
jgi:hypothetical protein